MSLIFFEGQGRKSKFAVTGGKNVANVCDLEWVLFGYFEFPSDVAMILKIILYKLLDVSSCKAVGLTKIYCRGCFWVETKAGGRAGAGLLGEQQRAPPHYLWV